MASRTLGIQRRRRGFLHNLLMAALQRAITIEKMHHSPVAVGEDLHFDMAGTLKVLLDQQLIVANAPAAPLRALERRQTPLDAKRRASLPPPPAALSGGKADRAASSARSAGS